METKVITTHELFQKHFGEVAGVGLKHPNMEAFFGELAEICNEENRQRLQEQEQEQEKEMKDDPTDTCCTGCRHRSVRRKRTSG
jgi:hypothetical protein